MDELISLGRLQTQHPGGVAVYRICEFQSRLIDESVDLVENPHIDPIIAEARMQSARFVIQSKRYGDWPVHALPGLSCVVRRKDS